MDRYDNNQDKTVAIMKVQKKEGMKDSVIVQLLTYNSNGQLASSTDMIRNIRHGKHIAYSPSGAVIEKGKYENDRKSSSWSWYGVDGNLDSLRTYYLWIFTTLR
jgi:antitoxin component YwqK of YwqJK toxin-antitoxin module